MLTMTDEEFAAAIRQPYIRLDEIVLREMAMRMNRKLYDDWQEEMERITNGVPGGSKPEGIIKARTKCQP